MQTVVAVQELVIRCVHNNLSVKMGKNISLSRSQGFSAQRAASEGTASQSCQGAVLRSSAHTPSQTAHAGFARRVPGTLGSLLPPGRGGSFHVPQARDQPHHGEMELKAGGVCPSFPSRNYPGQGCQPGCLLQSCSRAPLPPRVPRGPSTRFDPGGARTPQGSQV